MYLNRSTRRHIGCWLTNFAARRRETALRKRAYHDLRTQPDRILEDIGLLRDEFNQTVRRSDLPF